MSETTMMVAGLALIFTALVIVYFRMRIKPNPARDLSGFFEIDRTINGPVVKKGQDLLVTADGLVEGDMTANIVIVAGKILGNVVASDRVEILTEGSIVGDVTAPKLEIAQGAHLTGKVIITVRG